MNLTVYDPINLNKPVIKERSILYNLPPIGIGTIYVESLSSYVIRLAEKHSVRTKILTSSKISPDFIYKKPYGNKSFISGSLLLNPS